MKWDSVKAVPFYTFDIYMEVCYDIHTVTHCINEEEVNNEYRKNYNHGE